MAAVTPASETTRQAELISPQQTLGSVTEQVTALVTERPTSRTWWAGFLSAGLLVGALLYATGYLLIAGIGIWGVNVPVGWGLAILNFVWWIGLGHAGTLISAVLVLMRQEWRTSISRVAETMTLCALACAGLFPLLHLGRPWFFYWLLPYPNFQGIWPQFRSALVWDVFAILSYVIVAVVFWYLGLIPDLATMRDRAVRPWSRGLFGFLALGWRGEAYQWHYYQIAYLILAGLATELVVSHSIVALDFAITVIPGWHSTVLPPYFVAGAMHSGFAMMLFLTVPIRAAYGLQDFITPRHFDCIARLMIVTSLAVGYGHFVEGFQQWYSDKAADLYLLHARLSGHQAGLYWTLVVANVATPQLLWFPWVRRQRLGLWGIGVVVLIGMWLERYLVVIASLERDFLPGAWGPYRATVWDWALYAGTFGLFFSLFFLFLRLLPMLPMFELRRLIARRGEEGGRNERV